MKNALKFRFMPEEKRKQVYLGFYIFHGIEIMILLLLLGFYISPLFNLIFIGALFHLSTDLTSEIILKQRIDKVSIIQNFLANKKLVSLEEIEMH